MSNLMCENRAREARYYARSDWINHMGTSPQYSGNMMAMAYCPWCGALNTWEPQTTAQSLTRLTCKECGIMFDTAVCGLTYKPQRMVFSSGSTGTVIRRLPRVKSATED